MTTHPVVKALATTAGTAAAMAAPLVALDVMNSAAPGMTPAGPMPHRCPMFCRDCERAAEAASATLAAAEVEAEAEATVEGLLALSDEELAALDRYLDGDTEAEAEAFPDGLGWNWPGTDWNAVAPL